MNEALASDQSSLTGELDRLRRECSEMERQLQDQINNYDKDKALWEDRNIFLVQ